MIVLFIYLISVLIFYIIFSIKAFKALELEKANIITFADAFSLFCFCFLISFGWIIIIPTALIMQHSFLREE